MNPLHDRITIPLIMLILICGIIVGISQVRSTTVADRQNSGLIAPEINDKVQDKDNDGLHDFNCECSYCLEGWNDSVNEHNYYRLALTDSTILLVDNLTGKTVADISNDALLQNIIIKDNE